MVRIVYTAPQGADKETDPDQVRAVVARFNECLMHKKLYDRTIEFITKVRDNIVIYKAYSEKQLKVLEDTESLIMKLDSDEDDYYNQDFSNDDLPF
jgi:hypothetical protein